MKVLLISGSPRRGNSEAIITRLAEILKKMNVKTEIILLREKNIQRCGGCVEYCNKNLKCWKQDDMPSILDKMLKSDGYVFAAPNYFKMPPGIFKDFIDRCSILYTAQADLSKKRAAVIAVGTDTIPNINACRKNIEDFCKTLGIKVAAAKSFRSHSELKGNYDDIFESKLNPNIKKDLEQMAQKLCKR